MKQNNYGNSEMYLKIAFWLSLWAGTWCLVIFSSLPGQTKFALAFLHILTHFFIILNIGHDANHGAITSNPFFSALLKRSFDLVGFSSYCWRINHNKLHHHSTSIVGADPSSRGRKVMRMLAAEPRFFYHRFQHLYALPVYCLVTLNSVFIKDFADFITSRNFGKAFFECLFFKLFYITYTLIIPLAVLPYPPAAIIGTFLIGHFLLSPIVILIQVPHFNEKNVEVSHEDMSNDPHKNMDFILKHSADFAPKSKFWNWLLGGVNTHVAHHVYPQVCHVHLPALTEKLRNNFQEEKRNYHYFDTISESWSSHLRYLREMGVKDKR